VKGLFCDSPHSGFSLKLRRLVSVAVFVRLPLLVPLAPAGGAAEIFEPDKTGTEPPAKKTAGSVAKTLPA